MQSSELGLQKMPSRPLALSERRDSLQRKARSGSDAGNHTCRGESSLNTLQSRL